MDLKFTNRIFRNTLAALALTLCVTAAPLASLAEGQPTSAQPPAAQTVADESAPAEPGWDVQIIPVIWAPSTNMNLSYGDRTVGTTITPADLEGKFQFGGTGQVLARKGKWGLSAEGFYVNLAEDVSFRSVTGSMRVTQTIAQGTGQYRIKEGNVPVDLVFGARYYNFNMDTSFTSDPRLFTFDYHDTRKLSWVDPLIGAQTSFPLSDVFRFNLYGDLGGFGVGSDLSWRASGIFGWSINDSIDLLAGYSALGAKHRKGSGFDTVSFDFSMYGPVLGASFKL